MAREKKTFLELEVEHILAKHGNKKLEALKDSIDFSRIEKQLKLKLMGTRGRPPYEALKMFKILLLQAWYNLSDEGPKRARSTVLSPEEEAMCIALPKHTLLPLDDRLYTLQDKIPHLSRSALHRLFQRHDISRLPDV